MFLRSYPAGVDCVWVASDCIGNVGAFITSGVAPIPIDVLNNAAVSIEEIEDLLLELPKSSEAELLAAVKWPESFLELAGKGIFVYDWSNSHRKDNELINSYQHVAVPCFPVNVKMLPKKIKSLAVATCFSELRFSTVNELAVENYMSCICE